MITPTLETDRILLRPVTIADAETAYKSWTSDPDVARYMRWDLHLSISDTIEWLTLEECEMSSDTNYTWGLVMKDSGELFGTGGVYFNDDFQLYEIGYNIMKKYWNKGLVTEAARAFVSYAVDVLGAEILLGKHASPNAASGRVLEKVGFVYLKDSVCFSLDRRRSFACKEYIYHQ